MKIVVDDPIEPWLNDPSPEAFLGIGCEEHGKLQLGSEPMVSEVDGAL